MKKLFVKLIAVMMIAALCMAMSACGNNTEKAADASAETETEEAAADADAADDEEDESAREVVTSITEIDTGDMNDEPLQIESITLFDDGSVAVVPMDDLERNAESNDELEDGIMYPFAEFGKVRDIYLVRFGNGGYRTVIAIMEDGTLSAMSGKELVEDHIIVVMPNMTGRDNYVSVEEVEGEDAFGVNGITEDGQEIELDTVLNF